MKRADCIFVALLFLCFFTYPSYAQSSEDLVGRWEGVHYYGDTTRLYNGTLIVRATTIDSMKMILTIDRVQEGKFTGKLHEYFYSQPTRHYFDANVSGVIDEQEIHFTNFEIKENRLPAGNRWCKPKATGIMVKKEKVFSLNLFFETTLTCTIGPAILERDISVNITKLPTEIAEPPTKQKLSPNQQLEKPAPIISQQNDTISIADKFKRRNRSNNSTITVESDSVSIKFLDNATVDGDSISVFINDRLEAAHVRLTTAAFTINVKFEEGQDQIEVGMFAENLGSIPPNTALMQIIDGKKIHQAYLSSDTTSNAVVTIKRSK